MTSSGYREEKIYLESDRIGQDALDAVKDAIANNNAVGTIVGYYDDRLSILSVSDYLLNNLNYTLEEFQEFTKNSLKNIFCGENTSWVDAERFREIHGLGEGQMMTGDGAAIAVRLYKEDSVDSEGVPVWVLAVRVSWEHENLTLVNEATQSGTWHMDCDEKGTIKEVNWSHAFRRILGFHDVVDFPNVLESWSDLLHPDDYERVMTKLLDTISDRTNEVKYRVDYRLKMPDGTYQWFRAVAEVMRRKDGTARRIAGLLLNIENEKKVELHNQVLARNVAMEHLIQSMIRVIDYFAICDLENDQYEYHSINLEPGYAPTGRYEELRKTVTEKFKVLTLHESMIDCLSVENLRKQLTDKSAIYKFEYCTLKEDIFRMASFVPLEWKDGLLTKVLWIAMDVTDEKKLEIESRKALKEAFASAERANKAKTEFLSNMSHDIRTPMNAIVGLTALAGANIEHPDRVVEYLGKITSSSRHLLGLINEVLDMARIESGKIALSDEEFDISNLVDNLLVMIKPSIEDHEHTLQVEINHIEHESVCGDSLRIQQLFTNLMSNAVKYTPNGGNIKLSIKEKPNGFSDLGCFEFCIEDDGVGMTPEFQKIMFQPFSRADDHRTTQVQGTGLGMAITRNIVDMMNGDIQVESEPDKGTKITVTIYLKLQDKKIDKIKELMDLPVLVVDDEISACESAVAALEDIGIAGEWVTSGKEAVKRTFERHERKDDYYAILMDWQMPEMDGIETTRQIREKVGNDVTIIVLTAYDYTEIEEEARAAGVDAFITKPLFRSRLTATFQQIETGKTEKSEQYYLTNIAKEDYSEKRILLVEDNALNREIAMEILKMSNVQIEIATNGKEAVEKITAAKEGYFDLVFMDIQMPLMNGYEATAAIRGMHNKKSEIPIIAMTANAFAEDVQMAKNTGMNGHIAKPLELNKLNEVLKTWLR